MVEIKRVAYSFDQTLEAAGQDGYRFECFVSKDGQIVVDRQETFKTVQELLDGMEGVIPLLQAGEGR